MRVCTHCHDGNADDVTIPPLQEQRCRQGDESLLQKALDESRRDSQSGTHEVSSKMCVYAMDAMCVGTCMEHECEFV